MNKRTIGILILLSIVLFYTLGTGFTFFFRLLYVLMLLLGIGLAWAWLNLRGLDVQLIRSDHRGQAGQHLQGRINLFNRSRLPKSWLEVIEVTDLPGQSTGRGVAVMGGQNRTWRIETYLARRGVYHIGQIEITSQDPFGLFHMRRRFLEPQNYIVYPATIPLPDVDVRFARLPSDSRVSRRSDHITPDSSSIREYSHGDSLRRIHWPYTARMNTLMVKEFDIGVSSESWIMLDMQRTVQAGPFPDNTEELAVSIAASLSSRLIDLDMPVGLAAAGEQTYVLRPDSGPGQMGRLMDTLATVRALGSTSLERFIYDFGHQLNRFNTLTVITPSYRTEWVTALTSLRQHGVNLAVILIDGHSFGTSTSSSFVRDALFNSDIPVYLVQKGQSINEALRAPLNREAYTRPDETAAPSEAVKETAV